ncbi:hypothetical protein IQ06DRAFT_352632 [Phaeosphaeriaceae sp. SRC1lsM3a]|nr:hypothetical protein IQ06DRAFT_352632 [Stagonospora sp. SRC1lsM3a]
MRLIDVDTLELRSFTDDDIPPYAILSHTWGSDEISYQELVWINRIKALSGSFDQPSLSSSFTSSSTQDEQSSLMLASMEMLLRGNWNPGTSIGSMAEDDFRERPGYSKIVNAAREARELKLKWVWIDTCCIDKSSSAELQESLNSMYRWYWNAKVCLVYLSDISRPNGIDTTTVSDFAKAAFESCRWTKRGWTLQELLAPTTCRFYLQDWQYMGEKIEYLEELSHATGIPISALEDPAFVQEVSVSERMSWAANRQTTRLEDIGYCLLGLFDIQMPLLYGEGNRAFIRLQEEILKTTDDHSLFAWKANTSDRSIYRGLLARSPAEFGDCGSIEREGVLSTFPISSTPIGIRVQLEFLPNAVGDRTVLAMIRSCNALNQRLAIRLKCLDNGMQYARVDAGSLVAIDDWPTGQLRTIYVRQKLSIPVDFATPEFSRFHLRRRRANQSIPHVRVIGASTQSLNWDTFECALAPAQVNTTLVFLLRVQSHTYAHSLTFPVAVGFNRQTCHYWCKAIADMASEREYDIMGRWQEAARRRIPEYVQDPITGADAHRDLFVVGDGQIGINIEIKAGLCGDSIALQVHIDGLVEWS